MRNLYDKANSDSGKGAFQLLQERLERSRRREIPLALLGFLLVFFIPLLSHTDYCYYIGVVAIACWLGYSQAQFFQRKCLAEMTAYQDARALPWLLDYIHANPYHHRLTDPLMEAASRMLLSLKPEEVTVFTPMHLQKFNTILETDYRSTLQLELRYVVSSRLRQKYFARQANYRLGIVNVLPLIGNEQSLRVLQKALRTYTPKSNALSEYFHDEDLYEAIRMAIPPLEQRLTQLNDKRNLLRPSSLQENPSELLRPLTKAPNEPKEALLRAVGSEVPSPQSPLFDETEV